MAPDEINIRVDERPPGQRRASSSRPRGPWPMLAAVVGIVAIAALLFFVWLKTSVPDTSGRLDPDPTPRRTGRLSDQSVLSPEPASGNPPALPSGAEQLVDDLDGTLLWASPTSGPPISLAYAPPGAQCFIHLRPQALATHPEGEKILAALGPWGQAIVASLRELTQLQLDEIEALLVSIVPAKDRGYHIALRIHLAPEASTRFSGAAPELVGDHTYFSPPPGDSAEPAGRILVICPTQLASELVDSAGEPPPLVRDLESLVEHSDADRTATIIVSPKFLEASGSDLLVDDAEPLRIALRRLVGNEATAVALSLNWDDDFFAELRAVPALNVPPRRLAATLKQRIAEAPDEIEELVLATTWHPHGRKILARFPGMLRKFAGYARSAGDDRQALVRCYLPSIAGHNLLMAAELLLTQPQGDGALADAAAPAPAAALSTEERLKRPTSLSFAKESLDRAIELIAADTGLDISIAGADLQLDGITKNQSLALEVRDQPAAAVLVEILLRCNPDRTATGPADPRQKLVYVVEPAQQGAAGRIIVTTRTAAAQRQLPLPDVFVVPAP